MSSETKNLKLFKWDTSNQNDLKSQFDLNKSINENWDKIDEAVGAKADSAEVQSYKRQIPAGQATGDTITINDSSDLTIECISLKGKIYQETVPSIDNPVEIQAVTGEKEIIFTNIDSTKKQNNPISLGENEIFEDGYLNIEYAENAGYKTVTNATIVNNYGRYIFTGNEEYSASSAYTNADWFCGFISGNTKVQNVKNDAKMYATRFNKIGAYTAITDEECIRCNEQMHIRIRASRLTENTGNGIKMLLKEWYDAGTPLEIVYPLKTPQETEITDETLLSQLEALINAETYKNVTHINTISEGLKPSLEVVYKKDLETMFNNLNTALIAIGGV